MRNLLDLIRNNIIARILVHLFVFNFFCAQCFGMMPAERPLHISDFGPSDIRDVHLYNMPNASVDMRFTEDDFALACQAPGYSHTFSKRDAFSEGDLHHLRLDDDIDISIDTVAHKIFCHSFILNSSLRFSAVGYTLILNKLICQGLVNLTAENVSIPGVLSSGDGLVIGASTIENFGTVDAPYINMYARTFANLGKITGKEVSLTAESAADFKRDSSVLAVNKISVKCGGVTKFNSASVLSEQAEIQSGKFEAADSSLYAQNTFHLNGRSISLSDHTQLIHGKSVAINAGRFRCEDSKIESDLLRFSISGGLDSFISFRSEIFALKNLIIASRGDVRNLNSKIEAIDNIFIRCDFFTNAQTSLLEGGKIKIEAKNAVNHQSVIRSFREDVDMALHMNGSEFIPNVYARENARDSHTLAFEDRFKRKRTSDINARFPKPAATSSQSSQSSEPSTNTAPPKTESEQAETDGSKPTKKQEVGSFMNFSGEVISAGKLHISGSGGLYNITDSVMRSSGKMSLNFYGKILHKYRSVLETTSDFLATAQSGLFYSENSKILSRDFHMLSKECAFYDLSELTGTGSLDLRAGVFLNRGVIGFDGEGLIEYGKFDNSGTIQTGAAFQAKPIADFPEKRSLTNASGTISSEGNVSIESPGVAIHGKIKARDFLYRFTSPALLTEYDFSNTLNLSCESAVYDFGIGRLAVKTDLEFCVPTRIMASHFYNAAVVRSHAPLFIVASEIINGYEHNIPSSIKQFNGYRIKNFDWEMSQDQKIPMDTSDVIYIRPEALDCAASIVSEDDLHLEAKGRLYNSGCIESGKKLTIKGKRAQTGWASWSERTLQLPYVDGAQYRGFKCHDGVFDFPYDFFTPQKSIIRSYGDMDIDCEKFISSFGNVLVVGHLNATVSGLFLNYAGNIRSGQDSRIRAREFVNSIGTIATNESGLRYWKIAAASTDPAYLTCGGKLDIIVDSYFKNHASHIHSVGDTFLNGQLATEVLNGFDPTFVNTSSGTEYCRMYTISGVSISKSTRRRCGVSCGSSTTTTYWWQDINEIVKDNVIQAAISSAQQVAIDGFKGAKSTGVLDAKSIMATNIGEYGFSHGDRSRLQLKAIPEHQRKLAIADRVNLSSLLSDYLFANPITDVVKIPFVIIDDGSTDLSQVSLAMTIPEYAQAMYQEMQRAYSTARLSDMPTFSAGAELALRNSTAGTSLDASTMPNFSAAVSSAVIVKPEQVTSGIYFRPYKYPDTDKYSGKLTLFPELYLSDQSLSPILRDQYGVMHAEENIGVDTTGRFDATASVASGGRTEIRAKGATFETQTFDEHTTTQQNFASASGGGLWGSKTSGTKTQWERLITSRSPVFITTGRGLGICLQPGETADLKGVVAKIGGNLTVQNGNFTLTPLMVSEVSVGENGTYVIPEYFKTILDVDGNAEIDVDLFENTGSEIRVSGKLRIQANQVAQAVLSEEYLADETYGTSQSFLSSKVRHEKCYAQKVVMPTMSAQEIEMVSTGAVSLEGLVTSESDIRISAGGDVTTASRAFYQSLDYSETVKGPFSHANVRRIFSSPQIAPNIIRANGDFIINTLENYYMDGTQAHIVGNKTVNARNIISRPIRVEQREEIHSDVTSFSVGLPSSVLNAGFSFRFSNAGQQLLMQNPLYRSMHDLFNARRGAHYASALVQTGLATHDTLRTISEAMTHTNGQFTGGTALELVAKFFDVGTFGISHTSTHQTSVQRYGIPSMDYVLGQLTYNAADTASFIGHRASATDITVTAGDQIIVLPDVETTDFSMSQQSHSMGFNVITGDMRFGHGGSHGSQFSAVHRPAMFMSLGTNTFQAPHMTFTNPVLQAAHNRFIGDTEFVTLFDISREHSSSYNVGLSFNSRYGFAPRMSIGGSRGHSYDEFMPESGITGDVDIVGSSRNDSVPIYSPIAGNYLYSQHNPTHSSHSFGFGLSGIGLGSLEEFGSSTSRGIFSAAAGYSAGRLAQSLGLNEFWSSLGSSLASAYTSDAFIRELGGSSDGLSSLGHISESRNGSLLEVELVGFNKQQFNYEVQQIKQSIFEKAVEQGNSEEEAFERIELIGKYAEDFYDEAVENGTSHEEALVEVKENLPLADAVIEIDQQIKKDQSLEGTFDVTALKAASGITPETATLLLQRFGLEEKSSDVKLEACKIQVLLKFLELSRNPTQENANKFARVVRWIKSNGAAAADKILTGLGTVFGVQSAEAAVPAVVLPLIAEAGIFLAENPEFWQRCVQTLGSFMTMNTVLQDGMSEKRRADASAKSAPTAKPSTARGGASSSMPPEPDDENKKTRKSDTPQGQKEFWNQLKQSGEWEHRKEYSTSTLRNKKTGDLIQKSREKWEIEVFNRRGQHKGIIRPSEGIIRTEFAKPGRPIE